MPEFLAEELGWNHNQVSVAMLVLIGRLLHLASELATEKWLNDNSAALELYSPDSKSIDRHRLQRAAVMLFKERENIEAHLKACFIANK